jgi:hypothetical protein
MRFNAARCVCGSAGYGGFEKFCVGATVVSVFMPICATLMLIVS